MLMRCPGEQQGWGHRRLQGHTNRALLHRGAQQMFDHDHCCRGVSTDGSQPGGTEQGRGDAPSQSGFALHSSLRHRAALDTRITSTASVSKQSREEVQFSSPCPHRAGL